MHKTNCMQSFENISMWEVLVASVLKFRDNDVALEVVLGI